MIENSLIRRSMCWLITMVGSCLLTMNPLIAKSADERGPSGCPEGVSSKEYVCFTINEETKRQIKISLIESEIQLEKAKKPKRFGTTCGIGVGVDPFTGDGTIVAGCMYGLRF